MNKLHTPITQQQYAEDNPHASPRLHLLNNTYVLHNNKI